jgi:hypothetical protein
MGGWLVRQGTRPDVLRARLEQTDFEGGNGRAKLIVQPHPNAARVEELRGSIEFHADAVDRVHVRDYPGGFVVEWGWPKGDPPLCVFPNASMWRKDEIRFFPSGAVLNEFGYLYVGLYILGNYARYYPDRWISDVESGSPLALAAEEFLALAEARMALLTLAELSEVYLVVQE